MSGFIEIPKANENHDNYPCWISTADSSGKTIKPIIICNCGKYCGIGLHHVHADGTVTRSFYHKKGDIYPEDKNGCEWHVHIKLKDWIGLEFLPEK